VSGATSVVVGLAVAAAAPAALVGAAVAVRRARGGSGTASSRGLGRGADPTPVPDDGASGDGVYRLASSQPGIGPYGVAEASAGAGPPPGDEGVLSAAGEFRDPPGALDCENPWRCPEHSPFTGGD